LTERKRTKAEERANTEFHDTLLLIEQVRLDMKIDFERRKFENIPAEWSAIEDTVPVRRRKVRVNAAFDEDVAKFYRGMGHGYQARMNMVLRTYMLAILSRHIETRKNQDWTGRPI
jgi:uncharacterized protein (DUF4415 family)